MYKLFAHANSFDATGLVRHLTAIHAARQWLWPVLVQQLMEKRWTVDSTKKAVDAVKPIEDPPAWVHLEPVTISPIPAGASASHGLVCAGTQHNHHQWMIPRQAFSTDEPHPSSAW